MHWTNSGGFELSSFAVIRIFGTTSNRFQSSRPQMPNFALFDDDSEKGGAVRFEKRREVRPMQSPASRRAARRLLIR